MCEVKREYYKTGELKSECFEINGKKNGEEKTYHENGINPSRPTTDLFKTIQKRFSKDFRRLGGVLMGIMSFIQNIAESKELHSEGILRTHYYKSNYQNVKAVCVEYAAREKMDVRHIDDVHKELFLQANKFHIMVSIVQVNPIETSVDFKVEQYGMIGMNRPKKRIVDFYAYLDQQLVLKGISLHP